MNQPSLWSFEERASRSKFWLVFLLTTTASIILFFFTALAMPTLVLLGMFSPKIVSVFTIVVYILQVPLWLISIATSVRRFHDRNKSGLWYFVFIPAFATPWIPMSESLSFAVSIAVLLITLWFLIELGFFKGTVGANNFGNDPLLPSTPSSPNTGVASFTTVVSSTSTPSRTSTGKLIVFVVGGIILVALLGRLGWAFWQVRAEEQEKKVSQISAINDTGAVSSVIDAAPNRETGTIDDNAFVVTVGSTAPTNTNKATPAKTNSSASPTNNAPSATITVNGVTNLNIKYTGWYDLVWSSTNSNSFSGTESLSGCADPASNSPEMSSLVGQGSSGSISVPITPKHTGCTITYTFTVKKVETGQKASASAVLIVE